MDKSGDIEWQEYAREIAVALQRERIRRGLSQEDVAYRAGLSRFTYQKYEKGESRPGTPANPTVRSLLAISQVLDVPLTVLLPSTAPDLTLR